MSEPILKSDGIPINPNNEKDIVHNSEPICRAPKIKVNQVLVNKIISVNPQLTIEEAENKIEAAESKYTFMLGDVYQDDSIGRILIKEKNNLKVLNCLNLSSEEESLKLKKLENEFKKTQDEIFLTTGDNSDEIEKDIDTILFNGIANNLTEAQEIIVNGPLISGFEETEDPKISNNKISQFIENTFGIEALRKAKVGMITKDDEWRIYINNNDKFFKLCSQGILRMERGNLGIAKDEENYLKAAMTMEEVADPKLLKHNFKLRAEAGILSQFAKFSLGRLGIEKSSDFDYLEEIPLKTEDDKMRAYILGTIGHEIAHRYQPLLSPESMQEYYLIVEQENTNKRNKYVSDYVVKHREIYKSGELEILLEDIAETVRIYITNSSYLEKNYPHRLEFIEENFPFIKKDSVIESILN